jgi:hypothetical protein
MYINIQNMFPRLLLFEEARERKERKKEWSESESY